MPLLTRWHVRASFLFLVAALLAALAQSASVLGDLPAFFGALRPVYFHLFLVGWVTQLIFGVVFWMFPKATREQPRGSESLAWGVFWALNVGLVLRVIVEPIHALNPNAVLGWLLAISALLQWLAGLGFVANTWGRIKER